MLQLELSQLALRQKLCLLAKLLLFQIEIDEHCDFRPEHVGIERLEHVVHGAHRIALEDVRVFHVGGAEEKDRYVARLLARLDDLRSIEAAHLRHLNVEQNRREIVLTHALQSFLSRVRGDESLTERLQDRLEREEILRPVINQKQFHARVSGHRGGVLSFLTPVRVRLTSRGAIFPSGSTSASGTARIAADGMALLSAVDGSCTIPLPPRSTMCLSPRDPSSLAPVRMTPSVAFG